MWYRIVQVGIKRRRVIPCLHHFRRQAREILLLLLLPLQLSLLVVGEEEERKKGTCVRVCMPLPLPTVKRLSSFPFFGGASWFIPLFPPLATTVGSLLLSFPFLLCVTHGTLKTPAGYTVQHSTYSTSKNDRNECALTGSCRGKEIRLCLVILTK